MAKKRHTPEQVINKLREAEVAIAEGRSVLGWRQHASVCIHLVFPFRGLDLGANHKLRLFT